MSTFDTGVAEDRSPWTRPAFVASAVLIVVIAILGLVLVLTAPGTAPSPADPTTRVAPQAPADSAEASTCGLRAGSQAVPTRGPKANWRLVGTVATPTAPQTFGPGRRDGPIASCFAHSPTGALFANVSIYAALSALAADPPGDPRAVLRELIADTPGRDALLAETNESAPSSEDASAGVQVAGFNIVRYESSTAVVDLVFRVDRPAASGYVHATSTLKWERGDWRLALARGGQPFDSLQQVPSLQGYTPWRGV